MHWKSQRGFKEQKNRKLVAKAFVIPDHSHVIYGIIVRVAIFVAIANYEPLAINEIADLMFINGVKLELLDLLTDIKPLLYEERETDFEGVIEGQKNRYRLVNDNVRMGVLEYLGNEFSVQLEMILDVYSSELHKELLEEQCEGFQVVTAHLYDIVTEYNTNFTITENEYKSICYYIATKKK